METKKERLHLLSCRLDVEHDLLLLNIRFICKSETHKKMFKLTLDDNHNQLKTNSSLPTSYFFSIFNPSHNPRTGKVCTFLVVGHRAAGA